MSGIVYPQMLFYVKNVMFLKKIIYLVDVKSFCIGRALTQPSKGFVRPRVVFNLTVMM